MHISKRYPKRVRRPNRDTFDSVGQNWGLVSEPYHTPYSRVSWRTVVYDVLKTKLVLEYSTWASLGDVLGLTTRSNAWFDGRRSALEFQLIQQKDLEALLGRTHRLAPPMRAARDIRHWLLNMPAQLALAEPADADNILII